ncbi:uncharacterized protein ACN427_000967 isoform 1-T1 [Glossina fuscipes fuscipes]
MDTIYEVIIKKRNKMPAQAGADKVNNSLWSEERNPNNRHILPPIGVAVVLMTLYLAVQQHFVSCSYQSSSNLPSENIWSDLENDLKTQQKNGNNQNSILARLLEYEHICKDLEIFTKKFKTTTLAKETALEDNENVENIEKHECVGTKKTSPAKNKRRSIVPANKSTKYKFPVNTKKRHESKNKNSTAEPIIYMFALVFIYLLLKAASDINQHYKTQNKNDKRLRRCSLQSYAQSRRSTADRRASKGITVFQSKSVLT